MAGARPAFEAITESLDVDVRPITGWINVGRLRRKNRINSGFCELLRIRFKRPRILREVFFRPELRWIDEDRRDNSRAFATSAFDKRQMTGVQRAHRRHKADDFIFGAREASRFFHPGYGSDYFHGQRVYRNFRLSKFELS